MGARSGVRNHVTAVRLSFAEPPNACGRIRRGELRCAVYVGMLYAMYLRGRISTAKMDMARPLQEISRRRQKVEGRSNHGERPVARLLLFVVPSLPPQPPGSRRLDLASCSGNRLRPGSALFSSGCPDGGDNDDDDGDGDNSIIRQYDDIIIAPAIPLHQPHGGAEGG